MQRAARFSAPNLRFAGDVLNVAGDDVIAMKYPPSARVRSGSDFDRIFQHGRRKALPVLALHCLDSENSPRLGLAVSRKVDSRAVGRNRIKRILRDHFRLQRGFLKNADYVVVARPGAAKLTGDELRRAFDQLIRRCDARIERDQTLEVAGDAPHLSNSTTNN